MAPERLYLDYNATSPLSQSVISWLKSGDFLFANPASQHTSGKASRKLINQARSTLFETFSKNEKTTQLFFHSGATEAITTFSYSFSEWARVTNRELLICYSGIDHPAVTSLAEKFFGNHVRFYKLEIDQNLEYAHEKNYSYLQLEKEKNNNLVILYHHLWVHNETGIVSPLSELKRFKEIPDLYIHVDAVQSVGKVPDWMSLTHGDIFSYSAHKFGALKGNGFSFFEKNFPFYPLMLGGGQQYSVRSGTENPQGVESIVLALSDIKKMNIEDISKARKDLEDYLIQKLAGIGGVISSKGKIHNSNTIYFYFNDLSSDIALALFDLNGLMISAGSACSSGAAKPSMIMTHLGFKNEAKNGLRISLGFDHIELEVIKEKLDKIFKAIHSGRG